jgi:translation initiation factor 2B subunit (eIF-2B alpha/beta/delta family)
MIKEIANFLFIYVSKEAEQRRISEAQQRQHSVERIENINNNINSSNATFVHSSSNILTHSSSNNNLPAMRGFQVSYLVQFESYRPWIRNFS